MTDKRAILLEAALSLEAAGCSVVPTTVDGEKRPALDTWKQHQTTRPSRDQVRAWMESGRYDGLGIICGAVSGNLDMYELEGRAVAEGYLEKLTAALDDHGLGELWKRITSGYLERSPSGGLHILYRVEGTVRGNTKLARRPSTPEEFAAHKAKQQADIDRITDEAKRARRQTALDHITRYEQVPQTLIETRGEGGFVVTAPSGWRTHPTGEPWVMLAGGPDTIATVTEDERDALFAIASLLDSIPPPPPAPRPAATRSADDGDRPGDEFNAKADWDDILAGHFTRAYPCGAGWAWRREGKDRGISATTGTREGDNLFVFSTSTVFEDLKPYSKFAAYTLLEHGEGNFAAAAKELRRRGYGSPRRPENEFAGIYTPTPGGAAGSGPAPAPVSEGNLAVVHELHPPQGVPIPSPDNPMAVARHVAQAHMVVDGRYTMRFHNGEWMRWDGPHWTEISDAAIRAQLYPALEHETYIHVDAKGKVEERNWAPNRKKIADLAEALGAITYLPEATPTPSLLHGPGHGPGMDRVDRGADRGESGASPQVDRVGPGGPGTSGPQLLENLTEERGEGDAQSKQIGIHPVHPVHGTENGLSPAKTVDRAANRLPRSIDARAIVACANGLLAVRTRDLYALTPAFFNRVSVPFDYAPDAEAPKEWLAFLANLWPDDPEAIDTLQEWFGYLLSGRTDLQKILFLVGPPRSGKGTIGRIMSALVGEPNVASTNPTDLPTDFGLAALLGKTLAIMADARTPPQGNEALVERLLTISGEDSVVVKRKYKDDWMGRLAVRFVLMSNDLPGFRDASGAIVSRLTILRMTRSNLGNEDHGLADRLMGELPSIFNWALDGLDRLTERGHFAEPESSAAARDTLSDGASPIQAFLADCCHLAPDEKVPVDDIYEAWSRWCESAGHQSGSKANFGKLLFSAAPSVSPTRPFVDGVKVRMYAGISLGPAPEPAAADAPATGQTGTCLGCNTLMTIVSDGQLYHVSDDCERAYREKHGEPPRAQR